VMGLPVRKYILLLACGGTLGYIWNLRETVKKKRDFEGNKSAWQNWSIGTATSAVGDLPQPRFRGLILSPHTGVGAQKFFGTQVPIGGKQGGKEKTK